MTKRDYVLAACIALIIIFLGVSNILKTDKVASTQEQVRDLSNTNDCARQITGDINQRFQRNVGILTYNSILLRDENDPSKEKMLRIAITAAAEALAHAPDSGDLIAKQCKSKEGG